MTDRAAKDAPFDAFRNPPSPARYGPDRPGDHPPGEPATAGAPAVIGRPVVVMCGHGERATTAASLLERAGHPAVAVLTGGPPDWAEATGGRLE
jgi:rhodanese-related sulfurtransferase